MAVRFFETVRQIRKEDKPNSSLNGFGQLVLVHLSFPFHPAISRDMTAIQLQRAGRDNTTKLLADTTDLIF